MKILVGWWNPATGELVDIPGFDHVKNPKHWRMAVVETEICAVDGCESPAWTRGWCIKHYQRWARHGDPLHLKKKLPDDVVEAIRNDPRPQVDIAAEYGVTQPTVSYIKNRKRHR